MTRPAVILVALLEAGLAALTFTASILGQSSAGRYASLVAAWQAAGTLALSVHARSSLLFEACAGFLRWAPLYLLLAFLLNLALLRRGSWQGPRSWASRGCLAGAFALLVPLLLLAWCSVYFLGYDLYLAATAGAGRRERLNAMLMTASGMGHAGMTGRLIAEGADVNREDSSGRTALMKASLAGRVEAVRMLLVSGADPDAADRQGNTALSLARFFKQQEVATLLGGEGGSLPPP